MGGVAIGLDDGGPILAGTRLKLYPSVLDPDGAHLVCETSRWAVGVVCALLHHDAADGLGGRT